MSAENRLYFSTKSGDPLYYRLIFSPDLILPALKERKASGLVPLLAPQGSFRSSAYVRHKATL